MIFECKYCEEEKTEMGHLQNPRDCVLEASTNQLLRRDELRPAFAFSLTARLNRIITACTFLCLPRLAVPCELVV